MSEKNFMNKDEMVTAYAKKLSITKVEAEKRVTDMLEFIGDIFESDSCAGIKLVGYLTLSKEHKESRKGRNPRTKEEITIPAKNYAKIKFGSKLDKKLNK